MPATEILKVNSKSPEPEVIAQAAQLIRAGRLVAFPTETVYGLGANALDPQAIQGIYEAKGRPATDPLIVHIAALGELATIARDIPLLAYTLAERFWPGPLTFVLKRQAHVPASLSAGRDTVAVRLPSHPVAQALIRAAQTPIAAPSANLFAHPSPTTAAHVFNDLNGRVDLILDGGRTKVGVESTVLDLTAESPTILRPGGVSINKLLAIVPNLTLIEHTLKPTESASAPGQLLKHYSPQAKVLLFEGNPRALVAVMKDEAKRQIRAGKKVGILAFAEDYLTLSKLKVPIINLGRESDSETVAHNLFNGLRELDALSLDFILAREITREGLGLAVWDRLFRAAEGLTILVD